MQCALGAVAPLAAAVPLSCVPRCVAVGSHPVAGDLLVVCRCPVAVVAPAVRLLLPQRVLPAPLSPVDGSTRSFPPSPACPRVVVLVAVMPVVRRGVRGGPGALIVGTVGVLGVVDGAPLASLRPRWRRERRCDGGRGRGVLRVAEAVDGLDPGVLRLAEAVAPMASPRRRQAAAILRVVEPVAAAAAAAAAAVAAAADSKVAAAAPREKKSWVSKTIWSACWDSNVAK